MEIGKLYQIKNYYWMLYPSKDTAAVAAAAYCSKRLECNVSYMSPKDMFMLLEKDGIFCKILSTEGMVGWIILADWSKGDIEEVNSYNPAKIYSLTSTKPSGTMS
jgi:hypothetical protein